MDTVLNILLGVLTLIVLVWVAIFGGIGALLARSRGGSSASGLAWGTLLGPVGWTMIWWRSRSGRESLGADRWSGGRARSTTPPATPDYQEPRGEEGKSGGHYF